PITPHENGHIRARRPKIRRIRRHRPRLEPLRRGVADAAGADPPCRAGAHRHGLALAIASTFVVSRPPPLTPALGEKLKPALWPPRHATGSPFARASQNPPRERRGKKCQREGPPRRRLRDIRRLERSRKRPTGDTKWRKSGPFIQELMNAPFLP